MAQQQLSEAYKRDLLGQIQAHREATLAERQAYLEEGKRIKQQQMREKATLEAVSTNKSFWIRTVTRLQGLSPSQILLHVLAAQNCSP
jgi:predicted transposase YdaD